MPPPPSPGNINRVLTARQVETLEEEIRELKRRNGELEEDLKRMPELRDEDVTEMETLRQEMERSKQELEFLKTQLQTSDTNATDAVKILEELQEEHTAQQAELEAKLREIGDLRKELKLANERAEEELAAGAEARKDEVQKMLERAQAAEAEVNSMQVLVDDLTDAGRQMISLNETKQFELEERIRELEDKNRSLDEKLQKAREEQEKALLPPSPSTRQREAATAAEIDNETLNAQVKHLQNKLNLLEEELEEARAQAETDAETWKGKMNRVKDGEKAAREEIVALKSEIKELKEQANGARGKIGELEGALKENQVALESARAEIEGLRTEAAVSGALIMQSNVETDGSTGSSKLANDIASRKYQRKGIIRRSRRNQGTQNKAYYCDQCRGQGRLRYQEPNQRFGGRDCFSRGRNYHCELSYKVIKRTCTD